MTAQSMIEIYPKPLDDDQLLRLEALTLAVEFHKGNPNVTFTGGKMDVVYRTADGFVRYIREPR